MPARKPNKLYAVRAGRMPGIYSTWSECEAQVKSFPGAKYCGCNTKEEAQKYLEGVDLLAQSPAASEVANNAPTPPTAGSSKGKKRSFDDMSTIELSFEESIDPLVVYSDGACKGNGKGNSIAGIGVWWGDNDPRNLAERCPGEQTNNRAELYAICRVLETTSFRRAPLTIKTDSKYCIKAFNEWLPNWMKNNWQKSDGSPVKNVGLIQYIVTLRSARFRIGQKVFLEYVKGHSGNQGNDGADYLANVGTTKKEEEEKDWDSLRIDYDSRVQALIEARKIQLAGKGQDGILNVVGGQEAKAFTEDEVGSTADHERTKVRRTVEGSDASVKDSLHVPRADPSRRYSAGVAKPSDKELQDYADALFDDDDDDPSQ
ncbi:hypothetical protein D9757_002213 [Collybiopsis confluens]|uniref:Ribonuclease H n=1 Tax=Collybiopsis confluens TaxID=2823264 RepID=A0A8H5HZK0_9AGAR|nr:hypothetical protein D9757_002213 [Collybiopsis confluens]